MGLEQSVHESLLLVGVDGKQWHLQSVTATSRTSINDQTDRIAFSSPVIFLIMSITASHRTNICAQYLKINDNKWQSYIQALTTV